MWIITEMDIEAVVQGGSNLPSIREEVHSFQVLVYKIKS